MDDDDTEVVDAVPVPDIIAPRSPLGPEEGPRAGLVIAGPVVRNAAAVAMTSFAAGVATVAVVRRRRLRKARRRPAARKPLGDVLATRSFLVDIHLLGGERRS